MKTEEKASFSVLKIVIVCAILIFGLGFSAMATSTKITSVCIEFSNDSEINVLTSKTKVSEILKENNILLLSDEKVMPDLESEITEDRKIVIYKNAEEADIVKQIAVTENVKVENLIENYAPIIEKIETIKEEIPFETVTKDISKDAKEKTNKIIQKGQNGLREVTYKVKYRNEIEIAREEISSQVIKKPVDKIIQVNSKVVTSRSGGVRPASGTIAAKVEGKTPMVMNMNTSAYCSCVKCCGKSNGITSSGNKATSYYTVAAGKAYPIGTVIYIPYFKNKPNGGWFVVQDRGGAISNNRLDIFMDTHGQALTFGRRNLECYIYK